MNMAKSRNQKGKILVIEHLLQGTGESRIVTMQEILDKLLEYGITAERKSIESSFLLHNSICSILDKAMNKTFKVVFI